MRLTDAQIANRVASTQAFQGWRRKVHRLRRIAAGDISALDDGISASAQESELSRLARGDAHASDLYDILVTDIEEGRSNKLLQTVRTLIFQTSLVFPEIEFEDVDAQLAAINALYVKDRARRCAMQKHRRLALTDYLMCGVGATFAGYRDDYPFVEFQDMLDVTWDLTAQTFQECKWASRIVRRPLGAWLDDLEPKAASKLLKLLSTSREDATNDDNVVALACYYDIHGEGNEAMFYTASDGSDASEDNIIERIKNPYSDYYSGTRGVAIPISFSSFFAVPSVRNPIGIVEQMLPAQIAIWRADRVIRDTVEVGSPAREVEEDSYTQESWDAWLEDATSVLVRKQGRQPMNLSAPMDVPVRTMEYRNANEAELIAQGGANPYASGAPVKGVDYAAEVNAIQGNAGLVAATISKDESAAWTQDIRKLLATGADYDDSPFTVRLRDGNDVLELRFDENDPIRGYLRPDAEIVTREDSLMFVPPRERMARAAQDIQLAAGLPQFPQFLAKSLEDYLRAAGKKNISEYLTPAAPMPAEGGGDPNADPAMAAMASTLGA